MIAATVLAAGDSARMGSPKALLDYRGMTFLSSILQTLKQAGIERQLVVLSAELLNALSPSDLSHVESVISQEPAAGPIGSIRTALRLYRAERLRALLVWPVDLPHVHVDTIQCLTSSLDDEADILLPRFRGRRGHPVILGSGIFREVLELPSGQTMRAIVRADRSRVKEVDVDDPAVVDSVNTPRDYQRLVGG